MSEKEIKNFWKSKRWKERRAEILEKRNKCEICGLTQDQSLQVYNAGLVIHHLPQIAPLALWKQVANEKFNEAGQNYPGSFGERRKRRSEFNKNAKAAIDKEFRRRKKKLMTEYSNERYMELRDDDILVICKACHFKRKK